MAKKLGYGDMTGTFKTLGVTQNPVTPKQVTVTKSKYGQYDGIIVGKMTDYDAYHATKGKVNRNLGKY